MTEWDGMGMGMDFENSWERDGKWDQLDGNGREWEHNYTFCTPLIYIRLYKYVYGLLFCFYRKSD